MLKENLCLEERKLFTPPAMTVRGKCRVWSGLVFWGCLVLAFAGCQSDTSFEDEITGSVTFKLNAPGTDDKPVTQSFILGKTVRPPADPELEGYEFSGWYDVGRYHVESKVYDFTQKETRKDFTLYAWWLTGDGEVPDWLTGDEPDNPGGNGEDPEDPEAPESVAFIWIDGGTFTMGSPSTETDRRTDETQHSVTLTKGFYMGNYPVTQKEWQEVMGDNPSNFKGDNLPVEMVSWYDAVEYCNKRSEKVGLTPAYTITSRTPATGYPITDATITIDWSKNGYRLPTEAEWEYVARGGNNGNNPYYVYAGSNTVDDVAWYDGNSGSTTHPVGNKKPNSLGIYDMSGNVYEWCWDWHSDSYYSSSPASNPTGASSGSYRVLRGGSWFDSAGYVRSAYRGNAWPSYRFNFLGFRLVRP